MSFAKFTQAIPLLVMGLALVFAAHLARAQTETALYSFRGGSHGSAPQSRLTSDGAGNFYGTTAGGGLGAGVVFELSPNGNGGWNERVLYSFCSALSCADGANPLYSYVIFDSTGNLYGTAYSGGANNLGVVFKLTLVGKRWTETVVYSFPGGTHGYSPVNGLIMDASGNLYGTAGGGVFELSPSGGGWTEQVIYAVNTSGAGLTMDAAGNIFGVGVSTVFKLAPIGGGGWNPTVIHTFTGAPKDGSYPKGTPVLDQAGNLYGTTTMGGANNYGTVYELSPGTKGKWTKKILYSFSGIDGGDPWAGIVFDAVGNIYGATYGGGKAGGGTVFELVATVGKGGYKEKVLWSFSGKDGLGPYASLILDSAGNLYGTTDGGGARGNGVVFKVTP